ncbi:DUF1918 domain-containing protein [Streptomyces sp. NPDC012769]|uniref:DUF1918 domain-containing protein n=1 Tax=Streptomyces sp. NPDC012769 TaxID=3364848 RepID=UPI0036BCAFAD
MQANVGDQIIMTNRVGQHETVEVVDVRGADGAPPYLVRWPNGREALVHPGPDSEVIAGG